MSSSKKPGTARRLWLRGVLVGLGALALLALLVPVWIPWVLLPLLERQGVNVSGFDRQGYSLLELRGLTYTNESVTVKAGTLAVQSPHRWFLDRLGWFDRENEAQLRVSEWRVQVHPRTSTNQPPGTNSLSAALDQAGLIIERFRPWIHQVDAREGEFIFNARTTRVKTISVSRTSITAGLSEATSPAMQANLTIQFPRSNQFGLRLDVPDQKTRAGIELVRGTDGWSLNGGLTWQTNRADVSGSLGSDGWLPESLDVTADGWRVPAERLGLDGYRELIGGFKLGWTNRQYRFSVRGDAVPTVDNPLVPDRITIDIAGLGNFEALAVERLDIATPALQATLSDPLAIDFTGRMLVPEATLRVSADFIPADGLPFKGQLEGTVTARPAVDELVNADFAVQVNGFASELLNVDRLNLDGALHWPQLIVSNASFSFPDAGAFRLGGELQLLDRSLTNVHWSYRGALPTNLVPAGLSLETVTASGTASGRWPDLTHRTELAVMRPDWKGSRADEIRLAGSGVTTATNTWQLALKHDDLRLSGGGSIDLSKLADSSIDGLISELQFAPTADASLVLDQPAGLKLGWSTPSSSPVAIELTPLKLSGGGKHFEAAGHLRWPQAGSLRVVATNIATADLAGLLADPLPPVAVRGIVLNATWDQGPLLFNAETDVVWQQRLAGAVEGRLQVRGNAAGIEFSPVNVSGGGGEVLALTGNVPLQLIPADDNPVHWLDEGVFSVRLRSLEDAPVWNLVTDLTGVEFVEPHLDFAANGNLQTFQSQLEFRAREARSLRLTNLPPELGVLSNLQFRASAGRGSVELLEGAFTVAGQRGGFSAGLPVRADTWRGWLEKLRRPDWQQATGQVALPTIEMAALAPMLGNSLSPAGQAAAHLRLLEGGILDGYATVTNLATRPIEPMGSVRDIEGRIEFHDRRAEISSFRASLGGQPVRAGGTFAWNAGGLTNANVFLQATNISLVRSVDLFLRGDLDLRITADGRTPPKISGEVALNDSLLFQDIGNLVKLDLKQPEQRPPFFSVPEPPLARWGLDVRVRGKEFLRVLSPVFRGSVSTGLQLTGTLKEPAALGDVSIEKGQILFPFGSLDVTRGAVQLTRQNPHLPRVDFRGQGMNFGYNISVEVTGNSDSPNIIFNSVPSLSTREIMLMLTAGEIPSGAYSYTDVDKASKLGYFLGKEFINQLLGLDPGEDKLLFRTGEYVTDDGQLTYRIEYRLIDWLSVFGEYTRFRDYNGGLKFNLYSR